MAEKCEALTESLPAYLYGDLSDPEKKEIADHLDACEACAETLREFRGVREALDEIPIPPMPSTADLAARVMARARPSRVRRPLWAPLATAALILLGIGLGIGITHLLTPPTPREAITVADLETMLPSTHDPNVAVTIDRLASRKYGLPDRYIDRLMPPVNQQEIVTVDKHYRTLVKRTSGESKMLAAYFQLRLGEYYAKIAKDPERAEVELRKVFDFVDEGSLYIRAKDHLENHLRAEPEKH